MKTFPMFLKMTGRRVVIFGGGEQAAQKARLIAKSEADVVLIAPQLSAELHEMVARGAARYAGAQAHTAELSGAVLAFAASGCAGADAAHAALAKDLDVLVNAVDAPDICDAYTPAIVDRDPVVVAIGTEGAAPVLARQIKTRIEGFLEPSLGRFAAFAGQLRPKVAHHLPREAHRAFWTRAFSGPPRNALTGGDAEHAEALLEAGLTQDVVQAAPGRVSLVGAGPGAQDLMTLRGVKRLQDADVILYDRLVAPEVLELARRDAERICVGKTPGGTCLPERWSQARINRLIVAQAQAGRQVVRLKSGDPGIFGRAEEEIAACDAAGIDCEIVPGITAASGAMAELGESMTCRGHYDRATLMTGTDKTHAVPTGLADALTPGTRLAIYMGRHNATAIQAQLLEVAPASLQVDIIASATQPGHRHIRTRLGTLDEAACTLPAGAAALVFVSRPKVERQAKALRSI